MKKIGKILSTVTILTSVGVILSMGRDSWFSQGGRVVEKCRGSEFEIFGRHPAYALGRNPAGKLIFQDAGQALRQFRKDYPSQGEKLREIYGLPQLRQDTWELYRAYLEHDSQGSLAHHKLAKFLEIYQNSVAG